MLNKSTKDTKPSKADVRAEAINIIDNNDYWALISLQDKGEESAVTNFSMAIHGMTPTQLIASLSTIIYDSKPKNVKTETFLNSVFEVIHECILSVADAQEQALKGKKQPKRA